MEEAIFWLDEGRSLTHIQSEAEYGMVNRIICKRINPRPVCRRIIGSDGKWFLADSVLGYPAKQTEGQWLSGHPSAAA